MSKTNRRNSLDSLESQQTYQYSNPPSNSTYVQTTPLHEAVQDFDYDRLWPLLEYKKMDPNVKDSLGKTPLHLLLSDKFEGQINEPAMLECLKLLVEYKADVNERNADGETPLSLAVHHQFESSASYLVKHGAHTWIQTPRYNKPQKLAFMIAETMPDVMTEMLDDAVTFEKSENGLGKIVKLDWNPVLQYADHRANKTKLIVLRESSFLYYLVDLPIMAREEIMNHPLISAFIHLKTQAMLWNIRMFQIIMTVFPALYMLFVWWVYFKECKIEDDDNDEDGGSPPGTTENPGDEDDDSAIYERRCSFSITIHISGFLLGLVAVVLVAINAYIYLRVEWKYLRDWKPWVTVISLVLMLFTIWPTLQVQKDSYNLSWQYPVSALGAFFSWILFLIHLELFPRVKIYLESLVRILIRVVKIIIFFLPLLFGFFTGFNLMLADGKDYMQFILMIIDVGSDEFENIVEENNNDYRVWFRLMANLFGAAFIIVIGIVFMNYLLAASVTDIQDLKADAKVLALSNEIQRIFIRELFPGYQVYSILEKDENGKESQHRESRFFQYNPKDPNCELPEKICNELTEILKTREAFRREEQSKASYVVMRNSQKSASSAKSPPLSRISSMQRTVSFPEPANQPELASTPANNQSGNPRHFATGQHVYVKMQTKAGDETWALGTIVKSITPDVFVIDVDGKVIRRNNAFISAA